MGGGKETPRQKLIGLMYLVLMALLAMNVSKSILGAFITINEKFQHSAELTNGTTEGLMSNISKTLGGLKAEKATKEEIDRVKKIQQRGNEIRDLARRTANFFVTEAGSMINQSDPTVPTPFYTEEEGGYLKLNDLDTIQKKDDFDTAPHIFLKEGHEPSERGLAVENRYLNYRDSLIVMAAKYKEERGGEIKKYSIDPSIIVRPKEATNEGMKEFNASVEKALETVKPEDRSRIQRIIELLTIPEVVENHGEKYPWIAYQFDHAVIVAAATIFTSLKNDVMMAESIAIECVSSRAVGPTFNFNKIEPLAFSSTSYINKGDSLGLKVMIAAYDSLEEMELKYWIDDTTKSPSNMLEFTAEAGDLLGLSGGVGEHTVVGNIAVKVKGKKEFKPWKFTYSVGAPNGAIANAEMNVLYRNWDNKIEVSASGYDPSSVNITATPGIKIKKGKDGYIARVVGRTREATLTIKAKDKEGNSVKVADKKFRIFPLPTPRPYFGGQSTDKSVISKAKVQNANIVKALIGDSPLDVTYKVVSSKMSGVKNGKGFEMKAKGNRLTSQMKAYINRLGKGSKLVIESVVAEGPGGKSKSIGALVFKVI